MELNKVSAPKLWTPRELPKLADLHYDKEKAFKDDELLRLLNQPANANWMKEHPMIKVKVNGKWEQLKYMPIDHVKYILTRIFGLWRREIKDVKPFFNASLAIVRLHVQNPITGEWTYHDGVGAAPMQTDAGASATDASALKADAAMKAGGSSVSYALKNAAECFGSIFGGTFQNPDAIQFQGSYQQLADELKKSADNGNGLAAEALQGMTMGLPIIPEIKTEF